jgi:hypothetical protein
VPERCIPDLKVVETELITAFPHLQRLTALRLQTAATPVVVSHISALQSLQLLELFTSANNLPELPRSLTHLSLHSDQPCSLTAGSAACLSQLTALQYLGLSAKPSLALDTALLAGLRSLHTLHLWFFELAAGQPQVISRLTGLTSLVLSTQPAQQQAPVTISAAEAGALTSSSQLVNLLLSSSLGGPLLQDYASLFPAGRQLQQLTHVELSADFLKDAAAVQRAGSCCPNLRFAKFGRCGRVHDDDATEERLIAEGLTAAQVGWPQLRTLCLEDPLGAAPGALFWQALGGFSALRDLRISINSPEAEQPAASHVLLLEGCRRLWHLVIDMRADDGPVEPYAFRSWKLELHSTAPRGKRPNVSRRLRQQLMRTLPQLHESWDYYSDDCCDACGLDFELCECCHVCGMDFELCECDEFGFGLSDGEGGWDW